MVTYNHEAFIAQAVQSVLDQEGDFDIELVIGEDCSPDGTRAIVRSFAERHPDEIVLLCHEENVGAMENHRRVLEKCTGEYVAWLDGDDYWTRTDKLARQVEVLQERTELAMCCTASATVCMQGDEPPVPVYPSGRKPVYGLADLAEWLQILPCSIMFRNGKIDVFPPWFKQAPVGDWPLYFLIARHGDIGYIDEVMAAHRIHQGGVWESMRRDRAAALQSNIQTVKLLAEQLPETQRGPYERAVRRRQYDLAAHHAEHGDRRRAWGYLTSAYRGGGYDPQVSPSQPFRGLFHFCTPGLYGWLRKLKRGG